MAALRRKVTAGSVTFITVMSCTNKKRTKGKRNKKEKPTREAVLKTNEKNSHKDLSIKLNYNFRQGDLHITLTYAGDEPSRERAAKDLANFKKRLRGKKWICVTEYENKRIHHHIVVSGVSLEQIQEWWKNGFVKCTVLDGSGDYRVLAAYLIKETSKSFRDPKAVSRRRFNCSRAIKNPPVYVEEVKRLDPRDEPVVLKDTYLDQDSVFRGENPFTGKPYLEYVLLAVTPEKKRRLKGRKETYIPEPMYERWLKEFDTKNAQKQCEWQLNPRINC